MDLRGREFDLRTRSLGPTQHPDQHCPQRPILLAVDQEFGEGPGLGVLPVGADRIGPVQVRQHENVEQFGAGRGTESIEAFSQSAFEMIRPQLRTHGWRLRDH